VQKKDPALIRKTIEPALYPEYGGDGGAMIVLGGPWASQIAIHGTLAEAVGPVSHGCVRATNDIANHLMNSVAIGSIVIITR
jgi:lipoprotein-anchoring transpeptidase ErfK/SrfK